MRELYSRLLTDEGEDVAIGRIFRPTGLDQSDQVHGTPPVQAVQKLPDALDPLHRPAYIRLLNVHTLDLKLFVEDAPPYAILSHRWTEDEARFEDWEQDRHGSKKGYEKVRQFCDLICRKYPTIHWVWVDTVCIDKRLDAELSMSIRAMADWYRASDFCVVYMADVSCRPAPNKAVGGKYARSWLRKFSTSEWFKRGWTLQELLFPRNLLFCSRHWHVIDNDHVQKMTSGSSMMCLLSSITKVPEECLQDSRRIFEHSIAARLSWAAGRVTTRKEDEAYCLMGLFGISMDVMYGEGSNAFFRLQKTILETCDDESIFAWTIPGAPKPTAVEEPLYALLALEPKAFRGCEDILRDRDVEPGRSFAITNAGLRLSTTATSFRNLGSPKINQIGEILLISLNCTRIVSRDPDGTVIKEVCFIAIADLVLKGYGPRYVRLFSWSTGESLYCYLRDPLPGQCSESTEEDLPEKTYLAAYSTFWISASRLGHDAHSQRTRTLKTLREVWCPMK